MGSRSLKRGEQMHRMIMWDIYGCFACHLEGDRLLLTELIRSVWENLDQSRKYRPNALRSADTPPRSIFSDTDRLSLVNKMFIIWQTRKYYFGSCNWFLLGDILLANGDELNFNLSKFGLLFKSIT